MNEIGKMSKTFMKLAYVTDHNVADIHQWSGVSHFVARTLEKQGISLDYVEVANHSLVFHITSRIKRVYHRLRGKNYLPSRDLRQARLYASQIQQHRSLPQVDVIFAMSTIPVSFLDSPQPIVFWTDATFAGMQDFYPSFSHLPPETIRNGNTIEQAALDRCRLAIFSSKWAAQSAVNNYRVDPAKVKVVPFGANLNSEYSLDEIKTIIRSRCSTTCKLLFNGIDWVRKGGEIVLEAACRLHDQGIPVELSIVGCTPPLDLPDYINVFGYLSKATEAGRRKLDQLYRESHFLVVPSRAESYGLVFTEASAFGVPSLATRVGGIPEIIQDGKNGQTFPLDSPGSVYAEYISNYWSRPDQYEDLALSTFREYQARLNWQKSGELVKDLLEEYCC